MRAIAKAPFAEPVGTRTAARRQLVLLAISATAFLLLPAAGASAAPVTVELAGPGAGTVKGTSRVNRDALECSNAGNPGGSGTGVCSFDFAGAFPTPTIALTANGEDGFVFGGWSGDTGGYCAAGFANPCTFLRPAGPVSTTATFVPDPGPLQAATEAAGEVGDLGAMLRGTVNPQGAQVIACRFEYGLTAEYGTSVPCEQASLGEGEADLPVSAETRSLEPGTTYHYRLSATNLSGTTKGADRTFTTSGTPVCPNAPIRRLQGIGTLLLPDCMAFEMVSPPKKESQSARVFYRNPFGAAQLGGIGADNVRMLYLAQAGLAETPAQLNAFGDYYVATREPGRGWVTAPTSPPGGLVETTAPLSFSADFTSWFHRISASQLQLNQGIGQIFKAGLGEPLSPFSPPLVSTGGVKEEAGDNINFMAFLGASEDHSHFFFQPGSQGGLPGTTFLPGDPTPFGQSAERNTYVAALDADGEPTLELLARDAAGKAWGGNCGAHIGGLGANEGLPFNLGSVSADGSRVYFSTRSDQPPSGDCNPSAHKLRILERVETPAGPQISELIASECDRVANLPAVPACGATAPSGSPVPDNDDIFRGASVDGAKVYFLTNRQLASSDLDAGFGGISCVNGFGIFDGCDLYLYDSARPVGERLTQVSAGEASDATPGANAKVAGVIAISRDGSHAYFTAQDVLTTAPGPGGATAQAGQRNLYVWDAEAQELSFVAGFGASGGPGSPYPVPVTAQSGGVEVGGDGHVLLFSSGLPLTADDLDGGFVDVFRYDADAGTLERISKAAPGGEDGGPFDVGVGDSLGAENAFRIDTDYAERGRWVSEDAQTIAFKTAERLLPEDANAALDSYLWRQGALYLVPGTTDVDSTLQDQPVVSHDGSTVAFQTYAPFYPADGDSAADVYVLRAGGGFPNPPVQTTCEPDAREACQGPAGDGPAAGSAASAAFAGPGNVKPKARKKRRCPKGKRKARRRGKVRCVPKRSSRRKAKRHAEGRNRDANTDRRAAK